MDDRVFHETGLEFRQNMANLVREAIRQERRAVLLWLWDPEWRVYVLNRHAPRAEADPFPQVLRRRIARAKQPDAQPFDSAAWALSIGDQNPLRDWAATLQVTHEKFFPVWRNEWRDEKSERIPLAFVHVLTGELLDDQSRGAVEEQLVGVGASIVRSRAERLLGAVEKLLESQSGASDDASETTQQKWLAAAAQALTSVTRAHACVVFRPGELGSWESIAATGVDGLREARFTAAADGVIATAARTRQTIRRYDVLSSVTRSDADMFDAIAGELAGRDAFSCLVVPVVAGEETLFVFLFVNKRAEFHLAEAFTLTDRGVVELDAQLLAAVTPRFQLQEAVERASRIGAPGALDDERQRAELFAMMQHLLPQIDAGAIIHRAREKEALTVRMLGGTQWFEDAEAVVRQSDATRIDGRLVVSWPIPNVGTGDACLALRLQSPLSSADRQVLNAFGNELSHALHAETSIRAALDIAHQTQHALRAALTSILGGVQRAWKRLEICRLEDLDAREDEELGGALENARGEAQRLVEALNAPRFFLADIQPERLKLAPASVAAVLEDVRLALTAAAEVRRIRIDLDAPRDVQTAFDREMLYHALFNIVDNAVKYASRESNVRIAFRAEEGMCNITVENEGSSVAPSDRTRIFESFVRRTEEGKLRVPGTGLGLALARAVAVAHGGGIRVESEGHGTAARTCFIFSLPLAQPAAQPVPVKRDERVRTIHHLDDEPGTVQWIGSALRDDIALRHPEWQVSQISHSGPACSFTVQNESAELHVVHRMYVTSAEFRDAFVPHAVRGDVALIDVMTEDENGNTVPHGDDAWALATQHLGEEAVLFVTGFPRALGSRDVPPDRVISKPIDIDSFLVRISRSLRIDS